MTQRGLLVGIGLVLGATSCGSSEKKDESAGLGSESAGKGGVGSGGSAGGVDLLTGGAGTGGSAGTGVSGGVGVAGLGGASAAGSDSGATGGSAGSVAQGGAAGDPYAPTFSQSRCQPNGPTLEERTDVRVIYEPSGIDDASSLDLHGDLLYYATDKGQTWRLAPQILDLTLKELVLDHEFAWSIQVTDDYLFTVETNGRELWRTPLGTLPGTPELLLENAAEGFITDGTNLYFSDLSGGGTFALPVDAPAPAQPTLLSPNGASIGVQLAVGGGYVYYVENQSIERVPITGGEPELVTAVGAPRGLAVDDEALYLTSADDILRLPHGASVFTRIAVGTHRYEDSTYNNDIMELQVDGDRVYYREENGTLAWVKKDGSDCRVVAKLDGNEFDNPHFELSATHYYIIVKDQELVEIPRD